MELNARQLKTEKPRAMRPAIFDVQAAKNTMEAFTGATQIRCELHGKDGETMYCAERENSGCEFCRYMTEKAGLSFNCAQLHSYGAFQSERFGGRYIYFCPAGMAFFASPILMGGAFEGAFVGGPVRIMAEEDFLASDIMDGAVLSAADTIETMRLLAGVSYVEPRTLEHLSAQLFANAVYVGDSSHELFLRQTENSQQRTIGEYIAHLKQIGGHISYPIEKERELTQAINESNKPEANRLLNELLGSIYFYTENPDEIQARIIELLVVLSRAAIESGANAPQILDISQQYIRDVRTCTTQEELTRWLAGSLNRFNDLVFDMLDVKHNSALNLAVNYIKDHFMDKISLEEVAVRVGYSPTYFSKIFKQEMGLSFKEYLNNLRVEKSKPLLLGGNISISEICTIVGYNDQSYFCKTFKSITGTTPDKFRKRARRIDIKKEHGEF